MDKIDINNDIFRYRGLEKYDEYIEKYQSILNYLVKIYNATNI